MPPNRDRRYPVDSDDASFRVNRDGTGLTMSWKSVSLIILATAGVVGGYLDITGTAKRQAETLVMHGAALEKLETVTHDLDSKMNAILWQAGINPKKVVKDAAAGTEKQ